MRNLKLLKYTFNNVALHLYRNIQYILTLSLSIILISFAFITFFGLNSAYDACNRVLSAGLKNSGTIRSLDHKLISDEGLAFLDELQSRDIIDSFGSSDLRGNDILTDLVDTQRGHTQNYGYELSEVLEVLTMNPSLFDFCNINISEGESISNLDFSDESLIYLYLGHAYKNNVELGKIYQSNYSTSYKVAGFLGQDSRWINPNIALLFDSAKPTFNLDYAVIMLIKYPNTDSIFFNTENNFEETRKLILEAANAHGFTVAVGSLQTVYDTASTDNEIIADYIKQLTGIVLLSSIIIMSCLSTVMIYYNKAQYGIFLAVGFSEKDIIKMLVFEMLLKILFSLMLAFPIARFLSINWFAGAETSFINDIMRDKTFPIVLAVALLVTLVSWIIPITIFKKTPVTKMIRG